MVVAADFAAAIKAGKRCGTRRLVVHLGSDVGQSLPRVGFVVPKRALPRAVDRNRVKRQLRHLLRPKVGFLPAGTLMVVRALPGVRGATSDKLEQDIDNCLARLGIGADRG